MRSSCACRFCFSPVASLGCLLGWIGRGFSLFGAVFSTASRFPFHASTLAPTLLFAAGCVGVGCVSRSRIPTHIIPHSL
eukprot:scaffold5251_cov128-Isochrysis_galbana.AAC.2